MIQKLTHFFILSLTLSLLLPACSTMKKIGELNRATKIALVYFIGLPLIKNMRTHDKKRLQQALENKADNQSLAWKNTETQNQYEVTPINTFQTNDTYCRDYHTKARIDGKYYTQKARACRSPDGTWYNES